MLKAHFKCLATAKTQLNIFTEEAALVASIPRTAQP